jgi:hypothetical protein
VKLRENIGFALAKAQACPWQIARFGQLMRLRQQLARTPKTSGF